MRGGGDYKRTGHDSALHVPLVIAGGPYTGGRVIRTPQYLYAIFAPDAHGFFDSRADVYADDYLYDMSVDPWQFNNAVKDPSYHEVKEALRKDLLDWIEKVEGYRPAVIG